MGRFFGLITVLIIMGAGVYIYMRQAQSATIEGAGSPQGTVDLVGVRHDLMSIVQAERMHNSLHGGYGSLDELRSAGGLNMGRDGRGPYSYSVQIGDGGFRAIATYNGPADVVASKTISVDQDMKFSEE
jgi:hypothetical protein